jgi:FixJ family two-component response regulator
MEKFPTVSVVDDDSSARSVLSRLFRSVGYVVRVFPDSESFQEADIAGETDCLILDVHLPGMSGLQLQQELISSNKCCPIVFISAFADEHARTQALECGAVEFLGKPLDFEHLLTTINQILAKKDLED